MNLIYRSIKKILFSFYVIVLIATIFMLGMKVNANDQFAYPECQQSDINISNLFVLGNNIPIIPEACSMEDGMPRPLSPSLLVDIGIRAYAFLLSFMFTIMTPAFIGIGVLWIYGGVDPSMATFAKKWATNFGIGLIMLIFAYIVPLTLIDLLEVPAEQTNLDNFFTF